MAVEVAEDIGDRVRRHLATHTMENTKTTRNVEQAFTPGKMELATRANL